MKETGLSKTSWLHLASTHPARNHMHLNLFALLVGSTLTGYSQSTPTTPASGSVRFEENKGQVMNQHGHGRPDVRFTGSTQGVDFHIRTTGISYQFTRVDGLRSSSTDAEQRPGSPRSGEALMVPETITSHRIDIDWLAANTDPKVRPAGELPGYANYYNVPANDSPALLVKAYGSVIFEDLWNGVDLEYHARSGVLESDWTVQQPEDHTKIGFTVRGADLHVDEAGYLIMTTPLGSLREGRLIATQGGVERPVSWVVKGNVVSISVSDLEPNVPLIIDPPTRIWGTYLGGSGYEWPWNVVSDGLGGVYVAGSTLSATNIATTGAHQVTFSGQFDAFLCHFGGNGIPTWSTYYGGSDDDFGRDCAVSPINGDVFFSGATISGTGIATAGAHQELPCGTLDAFMVRFTAEGVRVWGTYYCGIDIEEGNACAVDELGYVYMAGWTLSEDSIATPGSVQAVHGSPNNMDAFLVKFDTAGTRLWGTYLGGAGEDRAYDCAVDGQGAVYLSGRAEELPTNATTGGHQPAFGGFVDAFLQKYNSDGALLWGTYYGGPDLDTWGYCAVDEDHVYLAGTTLSDSDISTPGAHQVAATSPGSFDDDGFVVQFDHNGQRNWGTYFGGPVGEAVLGMATDGNGSVLITGFTTSSSGIASLGSYDTSLDSLDEGFLAKFTRTGALHWSTYYGDYSYDVGKGCAALGGDIVYMVGNTYSTASIASPGAYDTTNDGPNDMFLVKFDGCDRGPIDLQPNAVASCGRDSVLLTVSAGFDCTWSPPDGLSAATGNSVLALPAATTTYFARHIDTNGCAAVDSVIFNVTTIDTAVILTGTVLSAAQANASYQWINCDSALAIPGATAQAYTVSEVGSYAVAIELNGCADTSPCVLVTGTGIADGPSGAVYHVAPNPTTGLIVVHGPALGSYRIELFNTIGSIIHAEWSTSERHELHIERLPAGIYWLRINEAVGFKVVKQ